MNYIDKEKLKADINKALEQAEGKVGDFKHGVADGYEKAKEKAKEEREKADNYIRENPEKSVLISAGIGVVVGAVLAAIMGCRGKR